VNISVSLLSSLHALVSGPFDPLKNYPFLGYSPDDFVEIDKIFRTEKETTASAIGKAPRVQFDPLDILYRKNGFFEKISYITTSFFNPNTMTDVKSTFTLEATSAIVADIKLKQQAIITYTDMETAYKEMTEVQRRDIRDAMGAARNEAIRATIYLRNLEHAYFQRLSSAEEGDDALGGGAYTQHGGALGESQFEALEEIAAEAAIFINSYFIDYSEEILREELGPVRNYTIDRIPDTSENNARKVEIFKHVLDMIPRSAAVTKANELLAKLKVAIADVAELSETDVRVIRTIDMLLDPFEPSPPGAGGERMYDVVRSDHIIRLLPALTDEDKVDYEDKIVIWGIMVIAYLGELVTNRISSGGSKSLFGEILGYPHENTIAGFTLQSKWEIMVMPPQGRERVQTAIGAAAGLAPGGPSTLTTVSGLLIELFIAMVKGKYAAARLLGGARKTIRNKRKTRHSKKYGRTTKRAGRKHRLTKRRR
jgi:hypothetical protein